MIDPSARISAEALIEPDVEIGPFTVIESGAVIRRGCKLYHSVYISGNTELQEGCVIHPFCVIGHIPQDKSWTEGADGRTVIGADSELREGVTVHRGTLPDSVTVLGQRCYLMAYAHVAHNCQIGDDVTVANNTALGGHCRVGNGAFISGNVSVHQQCSIGSYAMVSSSSFINRDLPPWCTASGVPAGVVGVNSIGLSRHGFSSESIRACKDAINIIINKVNPYKERIRLLQVASDDGNGYARQLIQFIGSSRRGLLVKRR